MFRIRPLLGNGGIEKLTVKEKKCLGLWLRLNKGLTRLLGRWFPPGIVPLTISPNRPVSLQDSWIFAGQNNGSLQHPKYLCDKATKGYWDQFSILTPYNSKWNYGYASRPLRCSAIVATRGLKSIRNLWFSVFLSNLRGSPGKKWPQEGDLGFLANTNIGGLRDKLEKGKNQGYNCTPAQ